MQLALTCHLVVMSWDLLTKLVDTLSAPENQVELVSHWSNFVVSLASCDGNPKFSLPFFSSEVTAALLLSS